MKKTTILGVVLAVALAASLVGNICLWNSLKRKNTEYMAVMARLEEELAQNKEAQDTLRQELEQTKADLEYVQAQHLERDENPVWVTDPDTGLPVLAPGNGDTSISERAQKELEDLLNGGGTGNGGNTGGNGNKGTLDISDFTLPDGATTSNEGHVGTKTPGSDTSNVPHYNPFA